MAYVVSVGQPQDSKSGKSTIRPVRIVGPDGKVVSTFLYSGWDLAELAGALSEALKGAAAGQPAGRRQVKLG